MRCGGAILLILIWVAVSSGNIKFTVKYFRSCKSEDPVQVYSTIRTVDGKQYVDGNYSSSVRVGNHIKGEVTISRKVGDKLQRLFKVQEDKACSALENYLGPFFTDVLQAASIRGCPVPPTKLHITNYQLDFDRLKLQTFPYATLHAVGIAIEKSTGREVACVETEFVTSKL